MKTITKYSYLLACVSVLLTGTIYAQSNQNESGDSLQNSECFVTTFPISPTFGGMDSCWTYEIIEGSFMVNNVQPMFLYIRKTVDDCSKLRIVSPPMKTTNMSSPYFGLKFRMDLDRYPPLGDSLLVQYRTNEEDEWKTIRSYVDTSVNGLNTDTMFLPDASDSYQIGLLLVCNTYNNMLLKQCMVADENQMWDRKYDSECYKRWGVATTFLEMNSCWTYDLIEGSFVVDSSQSSVLKIRGNNGSKLRIVSPPMRLLTISRPQLGLRYRIDARELTDRDSLLVQYRMSEEDEWNTIKSYGHSLVDGIYRDMISLPNLSDLYQIGLLVIGNNDHNIWLDECYVLELESMLHYNFRPGNYDAVTPTVRLGPIDDIKQTWALLRGSMDEGNQIIFEKGFECRVTTEDTISNSFICNDELAGYMGNLRPGTEYVCRAYAKTVSGTFYSNERTFRTLDNVGLESFESESEIELYPNPTQDRFVLKVENLQSDARVMVVDQVGKIIGEYVLLQGKNELEISLVDMPAGVYYVNIVGDRVSLCRKILRQ